MRAYEIHDFALASDLENNDASARVPLSTGTSLEKATHIAKTRMEGYWARKPPSMFAVSVVDDEGTHCVTWTWADQQSEYEQMMRMPYIIVERRAANTEIFTKGEMKALTGLRYLRSDLEIAKSKAKEMMIDEVKKNRKTMVLAVEVWDEAEDPDELKFRYTSLEAIDSITAG